MFGTSNAWSQPMISKLAYKHTDLTPIAAMAQDEFLLWVKQDAPIKTARITSRRCNEARTFKMGGAQSKDTDETPDAHDRQGGGDRSSPIFPSRAAPRPRCSSPAAISTPTPTIRARASGSGRARPSGRSASSARSACRPGPRSPRPKAGTTSRPASSRASTSRSSSSPAPSGCPARSRRTRSPSTST